MTETLTLPALRPSRGQRALWLMDRLDTAGAAYVIAAAGRFLTPVEPERLEEALRALVRRHAALRTVFPDAGGEPERRVLDGVDLRLDRIDAAGWSAATLERRLGEEAFRPFDVARGPLLRAVLFRRPEDGDRLVFAVHHLVADLWSLAVILGELGALYDGRPLASPRVPYDAFVASQEELVAGPEGDRQWTFWRDRLAGRPAALDLPTDRPRPPHQSFAGAARGFRLPAPAWQRLRKLGRSHGAPPVAVLLAAVDALLLRFTGQDDLVVGTPTAGRRSGRISDLVGYCVNPVPVRVDASGDPTFGELLDRVRAAALEAFDHQDLPFPLLVERLEERRDPSRPPLFQVTLGLQRARLGVGDGMAGFALGEPGARLRLGSLELVSERLVPRGAPFDLSVFTGEVEGELWGSLVYNRDLFDATTVERLARRFRRLLVEVAERPQRRLSRLRLLSPEEHQQVAVEWARGPAPPPHPPSVPARLAELAARAPDAVAVVAEGAAGRPLAVTRGELERRAGVVAARLRAAGVGPERVVALCLDRSVELVTAALAVLRAGGAYLPVDPAYPPERRRYMLRDSRAVLLVTARGAVPAAQREAAPCPVLFVEDVAGGDDGGEPPRAAPDAGVPPPAQAAYVIYTSGSTGRPKGTVLTHGGLANLVAWHEREYGRAVGERASMVAGTGFDASVWEVWSALATGASLAVPPAEVVPFPERLAAWLAARGITRSFLPTPLAEAVVEHREELAGAAFQTLLTGGDRLRSRPRPGDGFALVNHYGPTEATVVTTAGAVSPGGDRAPAIGRPIGGARVAVADPAPGGATDPVPPGVAGELHVAGAGLARGYVARPGLTAERFVPDRRAGAPGSPAGGRVYRTGDLVRWSREGEIEFLGRMDQQVKVRGFRVELGEIEAALTAQAPVAQAAVVARPGPGADTGARLVAFVVPREGRSGPDLPAALARSLAEILPEPMVPAAFVVLPELPSTPNGKVDRKALAAIAPEADAPGRASYRAPRTPTEETVAGVFAEVLGVERVGVDEDFFALGGHSLLATRVLSRVGEAFGRELPLARLFERPTVAGLAAVLDGEPVAGGPPAAAEPIRRRRSGAETAPLSYAQERLWFLEQLDPGQPVYHLAAAVRSRGVLDVAALHRALGALVRRHEALRTVFRAAGGEPVQRVLPPARPDLPRLDLRRLPPAVAGRAAREAARREARRPFDLEEGPLLRLLLADLPGGERLLVLVLHHIVADGWSVGVLLRDLGSLYGAALGGERPVLPDLPVQYGDHAAWQRERLAGERLASLTAWWRERLAGAPRLLELPTDRPRTAAPSRRGGVRRRLLAREVLRGLDSLARRRGATLFMVLAAAFDVLLHRWSRQTDVVVGTPVAGRDRPEVEELIGLFADTLVLRADLSGDPRFDELLGRVRRRVLEAFAHRELPFQVLAAEVAGARDAAVAPVFQVMLALQNAPAAALSLPGLELEAEPLDTGTAKFDLAVSFEETPGGLAGVWSYSAALFDATTVERLARQFEILARGIAEDPGRRLAELPVAGRAERHQVLREWSETPVAYPVAGLLPDMLRRRARETPDRVALVDGDRSLTWAALRRRYLGLARRLRTAGVGPEAVVGLAAERSFDMVVGLLGILEAGGAYLPLDPDHPRERIAFMLEDAAVEVVVTQERLRPRLPEGTGLRVVALDGIASEAPVRLEPPAIVPENAAYVIYTSGSTGRPKGVVLTHRSLASRVAFHVAELTPDNRYLQRTTLAFDISILQILSPILAGGLTVLVPRECESEPAALVELMARHRITHNGLPTSLVAQLLAEPGYPRLDSLQAVLTGADVVSPMLVEEFMARMEMPLQNRYGPTELCISITSWTSTPGVREVVVPIGRPIARARIQILDLDLRPVPVGVPGEIYGGGVNLARGYRNRPAATAERFVPDPYGPGRRRAAGERFYATGDLARWRADGQIEFLGRVDQQVKIRGFRIELGEVEAVLERCPGVWEAAAAARPDPGTGSSILAAYVVPEAGEAEPETLVAAARAFAAEHLPAYMVPSVVTLLDQLPRMSSGKVDRRALPDPRVPTAERGAASEPPETPVERALAEILGEVLQVEDPETRLGVHDDFFDLGGHSLKATQVLLRVEETFGVRVPVRRFFEEPTIAGLSVAVAEALVAEAGESLDS